MVLDVTKAFDAQNIFKKASLKYNFSPPSKEVLKLYYKQVNGVHIENNNINQAKHISAARIIFDLNTQKLIHNKYDVHTYMNYVHTT